MRPHNRVQRTKPGDCRSRSRATTRPVLRSVIHENSAKAD
jgi:hypothetical protein